ncbi:MAG: peptide deformylase [Anaerolineae bacterium]|nr:peptide deformylase [Anaerolineae bacterium]
MAVRRILQADEMIVQKKAKKVRDFGPPLKALVDDMVETMRAAPGIGLAAPQIGVPLRVIVVELPLVEEEDPQRGKLFVICNPEVVKSWGEEEGDEGCLSLPGYVGEVKRASKVTVKGQDLKGKKIRVKAQGLLARALQHEIDHLNGMLFTARLESIDKLRRLEKAQEETELAI